MGILGFGNGFDYESFSCWVSWFCI
ncbi:hypothetical protein CFP56_027896 [Quercus suber]|uniref:Uncharacterized protein n=1 Tax=Quercus suber TaxID=58331 RepID=A0AAW0JVT6_QUESU